MPDVIGLPAAMSRADAYIQGIRDGEEDILARLPLALCRGRACSHRKQRPCSLHLSEARGLAKRLRTARD